jgi:hypothetical protein
MLRAMWLALTAAVCSSTTMRLEGDVTAAGGDYADVAFDVPAGTQEIQIAHSDNSDTAILDFGVWGPAGYRGWSGGLTDDITIGVDQSSRGYLPGPIDAGTWTVAIGKALLDATGAHYTIDVTCKTTESLPVLAKAPYQAVVMSPDRRWYSGDFHVHSVQSGDASASLQANIDLAHSRGIDFINCSDHNTISQHALVAAQQPSWPILAMRGSEITTYSGHGNAVGIHDYVDHRLGYNGRTIKDVIDDVVAQGGIFIVNHPATNLGTQCIGCAWKHMDDVPWDEVSGIEVLTAGYKVGVVAFTPTVLAMWDQLEDQGHRLSAVSGSDDHSAGVGDDGAIGAPVGSPTSRVLADNLSEAAIMDAVRHHRTMVQLRGPTDPIVDFHLKAHDGSLAEIGDDVDGIAKAEITLHVTGGNTMFVQVWRDGAMTSETPVTSDDFTTTVEDVPAPGDHRYRVELVDVGNMRIVITSHIYVHAVAGADGGGCCQAGGNWLGGLVSLAPLILLVVPRRRRRPAA